MGEAKRKAQRREEPGLPPGSVYRLRVTLLGSDPPIWRRLEVEGDTTLAQLHRVLQVAMGWEDDHLHRFEAGGRDFGSGNPFEPSPGERAARLRRVAPSPGDVLYYEYDFGDGWEHEIVVETVAVPEPRVRYPRCIAGERAGPPEDCGGIRGYYDMLEALHDRTRADHESAVEWLGEAFDPEALDLEAINRRLQRSARRE